MKSNAARVLKFDVPDHSVFADKPIRLPRISSKLEDAIAQIKPLFSEWMIAEETFEHNTIEVAKGIARAYDLFKAHEPTSTKAQFSRLFDSSIAEDAKVRDLAGNATYNRIQYLLHKVIPASENPPAVSAAERREQREKLIHSEWKRFAKRLSNDTVRAEVQGFVARVLEEFLPTASIEKILS